jgi:alginate O-acetyltransferase complex protein AlgI
MLFNSFVFVFAFLPIAIAGFFGAARLDRKVAGFWLVVASFVFYGWWNPSFVVLLVISISFNYGMSEVIGACEKHPRRQAWLLGVTIAANLGALFYYKYLFWLLKALGSAGFFSGDYGDVILPLGISFFTFTQIGYLIDVKQGVAKDRGLLNYALFVTFFPHLIAGPILHNREIMPQFSEPRTYQFSLGNLSVGLMLFIMGLLKKGLLADPASELVTDGYAHSRDLALFASWDVALCYSLQLYFDFSGYSDMAIGLARMFNVRFPLNFNSPYKADCIIDYWQRWHMTLTRYVTLYIYNPIALWVTRRRVARGLPVSREARATVGGFAAMILLPTSVAIVLAGIWHGAGLQFLIFGLLHTFYLSVNHAWRILRSRGEQVKRDGDLVLRRIVKTLLTYMAVLVGSIFFRAPSVGAAFDVIGGALGLHGIGQNLQFGVRDVGWILGSYAIVWGLPNTQQIMRKYEPALGKIQPGPMPWLTWKPSLLWAVVAGAGATLAVLAMGGTTEFLYFQF